MPGVGVRLPQNSSSAHAVRQIKSNWKSKRTDLFEQSNFRPQSLGRGSHVAELKQGVYTACSEGWDMPSTAGFVRKCDQKLIAFGGLLGYWQLQGRRCCSHQECRTGLFGAFLEILWEGQDWRERNGDFWIKPEWAGGSRRTPTCFIDGKLRLRTVCCHIATE